MNYMPRTKTLLRFLDMWPPEDEGDNGYEWRQRLQLTLGVYFVVGITAYPLWILQDPVIPSNMKIESFLFAIIFCTMCYDYGCTYYLRHEFVTLFGALQDFDNFGVPPNAEKVNNIVDYISVAYAVYVFIAGSLTSVLNVCNTSKCKIYNQLHNITTACGSIGGIKYPYDISTGYLNYVHLAIAIFGILTICSKCAFFFGLAMGAIEAVIIRLDHLILQLQQVTSDDDFVLQQTRLRQSIMYHIHIIGLSDHINECLAPLSTPCLICYNVIIGLSILVTLNEPSPVFLYCLFGLVVGILVACIVGERLITKSTEVSEIVYDIKWYADTRLRRDLQLMILRSQKPLTLQCGALGELSLATFKKIMQGAYTYATMTSGTRQ